MKQYIKGGFLVWNGGKIPLKQFKYINISNFKTILENNSILFQNPTAFNDPFDCNYSVFYEKDYDKIKAFLKTTDIYKSGLYSSNDLEIQCKFLLNDYESGIKRLNDTVKDHTLNTGVSCFTTEENNLLMWAHYADKHRGVCLGFDVSKDFDFFATIHPIQYVDEHPIFNYFEKQETSFYEILTTKHKIWSYENEYRIIKKVNKKEYFFNKSCLTDIIFGFNIRNDIRYKEEIKSLIKEKAYPNVKFRQAHIMNNKYDLTYEDC